MRNKITIDTRVFIGVVAFALVVILINSANALKSTPTEEPIKHGVQQIAASQAAFLVSRPKAQKVSKKYSNAHKLTDKELKDLLRGVGFEGKALKVAWAIAKRESNGQPIRFNGNVKTGDNSYGLFQINMIGALGPDRREKYNLTSNAELFNPVTNAIIAFKMTNGGKDWSSWKGLTPRALEWLKKFPQQ